MDIWTRFDSLFTKYGGFDKSDLGFPRVLKAVCMNESSLGTHKKVARGLLFPSDIEGSKSEDGKSWGIMQITIPTAKEMDPEATPQKLNDPEYSIRLAADYLIWLQEQFLIHDNRVLEWTIKSYNQGPGRSKKEMKNTDEGRANDYWARFQKNLKIINGDLPRVGVYK